jgi:predicted ribosome quality control (RQC) complex YloA/Tae2 family protein
MPLDAVCLRAVLAELDRKAAGGRIDKVYQPDRDEIVLSIRGTQGALRLMMTAEPNAPRIHLIAGNRENPAAPPMFCMLLRKYVQGAKIVSISQPLLERMAVITLDTTDEMGVPVRRELICELMGKYSNIILKGDDGRIIDAIRRIDGDISGKRQVLPGLFYRLPPAQQNKQDPLTLDGAQLAAMVSKAEGQRLDKWLLGTLCGLSPLLCREIAYRATGDAAKPLAELSAADIDRLAAVFDEFLQAVRNADYQPVLLTRSEDGSVQDFSCFPIRQYEGLAKPHEMDSFSALLAAFYEKKGQAERLRRRAIDMIKTVTNARDRLSRKLGAQREELQQTQGRDAHKRMGELIAANFYQLEKGMTRAKVIDYFDEACPEVEITLDIRLTPQQNAQKYFKLYTKAKTAEEMLTKQIAEGEAELSYLESVLQAIDEAENEGDLAQLREELVQTGVLSQKQTKKRQQQKTSVPFEYRTSDGFSVWAGKNNLQNDLLSMKTAYKSDIWFHTQKIHGSHVILVVDGRQPTDTAMTEAAMIAAFHSKARHSSLVPVDYTEVRNLKKPNGSKPGFVIYHVYQTAYVTPDEEKIQSLRIR